MKKVLLIGSSACTVAIGQVYKNSGAKIFVYAEILNPGLADIAQDYQLGAFKDSEKLKRFANKIKPDFAFIGPPKALFCGVVDALKKINIPSIGPTQKNSKLESSKSFTRKLLNKYKVPGSIKYKIFTSPKGIEKFVDRLGGNFVVKADGPMSVMGVQVSGDHFKKNFQGIAFAKKCIKLHGRVVIEEKLIGEEFSLMSFCDGKSLSHMPAVQDFKRALINDKGQNTGGMGAYTDRNHLLPFISKEDYLRAGEINNLAIQALQKETGIKYKGVIFGGFMITAKGLKVLEFNVRTGDPEGIVAFSLLKTNLVDISNAIIAGRLGQLNIKFENKAGVCKYVVPKGYPEKGQKNKKIKIMSLPKGATPFTAWVKKTDSGLVINGDTDIGRSIAIFAKGKTLKEAENISEAGCRQIKGPLYHRSDIAKTDIINKKIIRMKKIKNKAL